MRRASSVAYRCLLKYAIWLALSRSQLACSTCGPAGVGRQRMQLRVCESRMGGAISSQAQAKSSQAGGAMCYTAPRWVPAETAGCAQLLLVQPQQARPRQERCRRALSASSSTKRGSLGSSPRPSIKPCSAQSSQRSRLLSQTRGIARHVQTWGPTQRPSHSWLPQPQLCKSHAVTTRLGVHKHQAVHGVGVVQRKVQRDGAAQAGAHNHGGAAAHHLAPDGVQVLALLLGACTPAVQYSTAMPVSWRGQPTN